MRRQSMSFTHSKSGRARRRIAISRSRAGGWPKPSASGKAEYSKTAIPDSIMTPSSGNVFEDVGFPPEEARNLLLRADLMISIEQLIERRKLTQAKAAKLFGVT